MLGMYILRIPILPCLELQYVTILREKFCKRKFKPYYLDTFFLDTLISMILK